MKVVSISDVHGRDLWKRVFEKESADQYVFLGDYFDTFDKISTDDQIKNFREIMATGATILVGNHDFHYFRGVGEEYSGKQMHKAFDIQEAVEAARPEMDITYRVGNVIYSHAGISQVWLEDWREDAEDNLLSLYHAGYDQYGDSVHDGPLWIRPRSLLASKIEGYVQIVGHTRVKEPYCEGDIHFTDCDNEWYTVNNDGEVTYGRI